MPHKRQQENGPISPLRMPGASQRGGVGGGGDVHVRVIHQKLGRCVDLFIMEGGGESERREKLEMV